MAGTLSGVAEIDECVDEVIGGLVDGGLHLGSPPPMKTNDIRVNAVGLVSGGASMSVGRQVGGGVGVGEATGGR